MISLDKIKEKINQELNIAVLYLYNMNKGRISRVESFQDGKVYLYKISVANQ